MSPREVFVAGFGLAIYHAMRTYIEENRDKLISMDDGSADAVSTAAAD